jgi:putative membrane protein
MMLLWIFFLAVVAVAIWYIGSKSNSNLPWGEEREDALDILKKRFALGEIDEEEYEERRAVLEDEY